MNGAPSHPPDKNHSRLSAIGLLSELKRMGVKSASIECGSEGDVWSIRQVEFFPAEPPVDNSPSLPKHLDLGGPKVCACGHDETQHAGDFCLLGCHSLVCNPPKSDAQKATDAP